MSEPTLESLARRVEALERAFAERMPVSPYEWRGVVGMFKGSEVMRQVEAEGRAIRQADRDADQREDVPA